MASCFASVAKNGNNWLIFVWYNTKTNIHVTSVLVNNLFLTERKGCTGEYWPEVVAVRTERSKVHTKMTKGQYSPVQLKLARLVCSLLYGTRAMLALNLPAFKNKKYTANNGFHGNGPYMETVCMAKS